jgi:hypothetical protein
MAMMVLTPHRFGGGIAGLVAVFVLLGIGIYMMQQRLVAKAFKPHGQSSTIAEEVTEGLVEMTRKPSRGPGDSRPVRSESLDCALGNMHRDDSGFVRDTSTDRVVPSHAARGGESIQGQSSVIAEDGGPALGNINIFTRVLGN